MDMPAHLKLKERQPGQGDAAEQTEIDFKTQLLKDERDRDLKKKGLTTASITDDHNDDFSSVKRLRTGMATALTIKTPFPQDADERFDEESDEEDEKESEQ